MGFEEMTEAHLVDIGFWPVSEWDWTTTEDGQRGPVPSRPR